MLRELAGPPRILPLYARAAAPLLPGASRLPFVPGAGREIPDLELGLSDVYSDPGRVAAYAKVCGFTLRNELPGTYPHVLAFPLHMALMADRSFPFGAVGLVHTANEIVQHQPIELGEPLRLRVRATSLEAHPRGRTFSILTEAYASEQLIWEERSTMLRRGSSSSAMGPDDSADGPNDSADGPDPSEMNATRAHARTRGATFFESTDTAWHPSAEWRLAGDLGRRYGAVSGDRNPIHMHALSAKLLGFPRAIAHGMWSKARCLATLEGRLPDAYSIEVRFRRPILLPGKVLLSEAQRSDGWSMRLDDARATDTHLEAIVIAHLAADVKRDAEEAGR